MSRVLVGMSGGVDSSVAAALLVRQGLDVIGVSLQLYDHSQGGRAARCCSPEDFLDARRVAAALGIPYYVVNQEEPFGRLVLQDFVSEYRAGRTPNPCVRCNTGVKFPALLRLASALGASRVATGHYARLARLPGEESLSLLRARDLSKDQSYFLFDLPARDLDRLLFPLGEITKLQAREIARELRLATAGKPESQDVCFVEGGDYRAFLRSRAGGAGPLEEAGDVVDTAGRRIGRHEGLSGFTVGQRRGLGIASSARLYVVALEPAEHRVVLGSREELLCAGVKVSGLRLAGPSRDPFAATVRVRYRHEGVAARVTPKGREADVEFELPLRGVAPGQAAVFYQGDRVLGGGWIESSRPAGAARAGSGRFDPEAAPA